MTEDELFTVLGTWPSPGTALRNTTTGVVHRLDRSWLPRCGWGWNRGLKSPVEIIEPPIKATITCRACLAGKARRDGPWL